jgi:type IV secretion system protein VirB10
MKGRAAVDGERASAGVVQPTEPGLRSRQQLPLVVVSVLGAAILGWYYHHVSHAPADPATRERARARPAVTSEMALPALDWRPSGATPDKATERSATTSPPVSNGRLAVAAPAEGEAADLHRQLRPQVAPVLLHGPVIPLADAIATRTTGIAPLGEVATAPPVEGSAPAGAGLRRRTLADSLVPTVTEPAEALLLPTLRWLLPKGAFIECTLETAIDSTLPGMATCVLAADVFGADGRIVLLERGSRLVGETQTDVGATQSRIAVLWAEVRTPTGVVVHLASPATDAVGGTGIPGAADRHFGARFGAAVLLSMINGAVSAAVAHQQSSAGIVYSAQGSQEVGTEALRGTVGIMPTIRVLPGARIQVLVARDIDFRSVYRLVRSGDG